MVNREPLWASGPGEILRHGIALLEVDSDTNRRLAMISIDNSVELMLKTFLGLPKRVTGLQISRKDREEYLTSFPGLLDGVEKFASDRLISINLAEIEWFHRLRNELYHQGNGLTVERSKVEVYAELATTLFYNLFGVELSVASTKNMTVLGNFLSLWVRIENAIKKIVGSEVKNSPFVQFQQFGRTRVVPALTIDKLHDLRRIRNRLVHGDGDPSELLNERTMKEIEAVAVQVERAANMGHSNG